MNEQMKKIKVIAIFGKSSSGKNTVLSAFAGLPADYNIHICTVSTTRPPREGEEDGIDYHFYDKYNEKNPIWYTCFRGWYYWLSPSELKEDKINIIVANQLAIPQMINDDRLNLKIMRVEADDRTRLLRSIFRGDDPYEVCRRFVKEDEEYKYLNFESDIIYCNGASMVPVDVEEIETIMNNIDW